MMSDRTIPADWRMTSCGRFVRILGKSGRRYIFSNVTARHSSLFRGGIFLIVDTAESRPRFASMQEVTAMPDGAEGYVHLPRQMSDRDATVDDLDAGIAADREAA